MSRIVIVRLVVPVVFAGTMVLTTLAQSNPNPALQKEPESRKKLVPLDLPFPPFMPQRSDESQRETYQRECDRPRACGCHCDDMPPAEVQKK